MVIYTLVGPEVQLKLPHERRTAGERARPPSLSPAGMLDTIVSVESDMWVTGHPQGFSCRLGALRSDANAV